MEFSYKVSLMADDADDWYDISPKAQLVLFPHLSANVAAILCLI